MRERTRNILTTLVLILLMVPAVYFTYVKFSVEGLFANDPAGTIWLTVLFLVIGIVLNNWVGTFLHELGHLLFGLANRFYAYSFRIGPLTFTKSGAGMRLRLTLRHHYGTCIMVPKTADHFYRHTFRKVLGGPFVSLLFAVSGWCILYFAAALPAAWYAVLGVGAVVNTYMFLRELLPYSNAETENDGAQLLGILHETPRMQVNLKLFGIQCMIMGGTRPGEIDERMFFDVPVLADNCQERLLLENYRYLYYLDRGDVETALKCSDFIEQYVGELGDVYRPSLLTDIFFNYVHYRGERKKAADLYWDIEKYLKLDHNVVNLRIRMAHELYIEELPKRAIATGQEALAVKDKFIMRGIVPLEEKLIGELMEKAVALREQQAQKKPEGSFTEYKG